MAFEKLRREYEQNRIREEQRRISEAETVARIARQNTSEEAKKEARAKIERARIAELRRKTLIFREESGIVGKLTAFIEIVNQAKAPALGLSLIEDARDFHEKPGSVVDLVTWNDSLESRRKVRSQIGPSIEGDAGVWKIEWIEQRSYNYLFAETFSDGKINIAGRIPFINVLGFCLDGYSRSFPRKSWQVNGQSRPAIFEQAIVRSYNRPEKRYYTREIK